MKPHLYLIKFVVFNVIGYYAFLKFIIYFSELGHNSSGILAILGWIFYMGLLTTLLPLFPFLFNRNKAREWFSVPYRWASLLLLALNIFGWFFVSGLVLQEIYF
jgi:hypothetical protein